MFRLIAGWLLCISLVVGCQVPVWDGVDPASLNFPDGLIFRTFIEIGTPGILFYETPIQFRLIQIVNLGIYSTMAMYEPNALDHFGRPLVSAERRICAAGAEREKHRQAALAYFLLFGSAHVPESETAFKPIAASWGMDIHICDEPGSCANPATPWGLAKLWADEIAVFAATDGWNADGSLSRIHNKIAYQDWREDSYIPQNSPWELRRRQRWQPLLEHDGKGYLRYQEHVTPQIGQCGRSIFLTDQEICALEVPKPRYDLDAEIELTFARLAGLTDAQKVEIEFFDSKLTSLVPLTAQWFVRATGGTTDDWNFILLDSMIINALYESVLVVWKEKERYDLVRPPSYAHAEYGDELITSWAGPYQGTQALLGRDWQPYIRTMPHSEYPSASACACAVFESVMKHQTGLDNFTATTNGPLEVTHLQGSGRMEPGLMPATNLTSLFSSWSDISGRCGQSRLNGGMRFTAAVPRGHELCYDLGTKIALIFEGLNEGRVPAYVVDIEAPFPAQERC